MEQLTAPSILSLFDTNKEQRKSFVAQVISQLEQGIGDPLKVHYQVKCMEKIIEAINADKQYRNLVLDAAEKYGQKEFDFGFSKIKIGEVGSKYDYSQCNDPELAELEAKAKEYSDKMKARQKFLQTVPTEGLDVRVGDEIVTVYPPAKSSTTSVIVTLK